MSSASPPTSKTIGAIAARHDLAIVQDACEAIGAERNGKRVGGAGIAKAAVFAFYPNKQMTTGEGGIVVTDDDQYAQVLRSLANQGRDDAGTWMNHVRLGYNYRLDEMSAALGLSQVTRLDTSWPAAPRSPPGTPNGWPASMASRVPYVAPETTRMSWFVYVIRLAEGIDRDALIPETAGRRRSRSPLLRPDPSPAVLPRTIRVPGGDFPVTEPVAKTTLAIPSLPT